MHLRIMENRREALERDVYLMHSKTVDNRELSTEDGNHVP